MVAGKRTRFNNNSDKTATTGNSTFSRPHMSLKGGSKYCAWRTLNPSTEEIFLSRNQIKS